MWGFYTPFEENFTEENYLKTVRTYLTYGAISWAEGKRSGYETQYGVDIPADIVEDTIKSHFLLTSEQIRNMTATQSENEYEYYDPTGKVYHFGGGYGGGSNTAVVSDSKLEGNILTLTCDWYGMDSNYIKSNVLTIRLEENGGYHYLANKLLENPNPKQ